MKPNDTIKVDIFKIDNPDKNPEENVLPEYGL